VPRLWRRSRKSQQKNPINFWKLLVIGLVGCFIVLMGGYSLLSYTNSSKFCSSCHEMAPEYQTYTASSHNQISCVQCHIKPGFKNLITHKLKSTKEVYYHVTEIPDQIVQTEEEAISSENCLQCHSKNRLVTASGDVKVNHKGHIESDVPCITCHAGVAHGKIAARGLNISNYLGYWTKETTQKAMEESDVGPNMGICVDCHEKVNKGEQPWNDITYSLPTNPEISEIIKADTQSIILQRLANQKVNVKVSMACETCHKEVAVPRSHQNSDWDYNHGTTAIQGLDNCLICHQDSKWFKDIPKNNIAEFFLMESPKQTNFELIRNNSFCSNCHSNRPPSHAIGPWIKGHAYMSIDDKDKWKCYVCHSEKKPLPGEVKAPAEVYCEYCHKNGFSGILNSKIGD
jgi:nitrate/TMAO reductase-like tetraheme cytochrome c subunit